MNFFSSKPKTKTVADVVRGFRDCAIKLESNGVTTSEGKKRLNDELAKTLSQMKAVLNGDGDGEPSPESISQLASEVYAQDVLRLMIVSLDRMDFDAKKDVQQIFSLLLRRKIGDRFPTAEYLKRNPQVIFLVLSGYGNEDIAMNCGAILKETLRHESLARILLYSDEFYLFPAYIENTTFGTSCDAFGNMKETLTRHKPMVAVYLEANYDRFFTTYQSLILSANYVTRRQSLKLLGEILLDRANFNIMTRYIGSKENLQIIMNTLRDKSKNIQYEAFHVFKVFVANPNKPPSISMILKKNKDRLLVFLRDFHNDRDDEQFNDEKTYLIQQIEML